MIGHPAKFSAPVLDTIRLHVANLAVEIGSPPKVLDPFAGAGGIHDLAAIAYTFGVELEPEWCDVGDWREQPWIVTGLTVVGDVLRLDRISAPRTMDAVVTSPCYGNRLADTYDGRGTCQFCDGLGQVVIRSDTGFPAQAATCPRCQGTRRDRSRRNTYRISLNRMPTDGSAAIMQWGGPGSDYCTFHSLALGQMIRVVRPGGLVLVNMSNHIRDSEEQPVVEWWVAEMIEAGLRIETVDKIVTRRYRFGANHAARVDGERLIVARRCD